MVIHDDYERINDILELMIGLGRGRIEPLLINLIEARYKMSIVEYYGERTKEKGINRFEVTMVFSPNFIDCDIHVVLNYLEEVDITGNYTWLEDFRVEQAPKNKERKNIYRKGYVIGEIELRKYIYDKFLGMKRKVIESAIIKYTEDKYGVTLEDILPCKILDFKEGKQLEVSIRFSDRTIVHLFYLTEEDDVLCSCEVNQWWT